MADLMIGFYVNNGCVRASSIVCFSIGGYVQDKDLCAPSIDPCVLEHRALWQAARLCARASRSSKSSSCPHAHLVGLNMPLPIPTHDHDDDDHDNDDDGDDGDHDDYQYAPLLDPLAAHRY